MFGPLFHKELIETSRRRRYFLARIALGVALLTGVWATMPSAATLSPWSRQGTANFKAASAAQQGRFLRQARQRGLPGGPAGNGSLLSTAELALAGQRLYYLWSFGVAFGIFLLTPPMVGGVIAGEKDAKTFETLLTTLLTDGEILWGKLAGRFYLLLAMMLASYPVLAIGSMFGGFDQWMVAKAMGVHLALLTFAAAVSLSQSVTSRSPYIAMIRAYALLACCWWLVPTLAMWLLPTNSPYASIVGLFVPTATLAEVGAESDRSSWTTPQPIPGRPGAFATTQIILAVPRATLLPATCLVGALWLFARARRRLRHEKFWTGDPLLVRFVRRVYRGTMNGIRGFVERRQHFVGLGALWRAEVASRTVGRLDYWLGEPTNPMLLRNRTSNAYDPEKFIAVLQIVLWIGCLGAVAYGVVSGELFAFRSQFQEYVAQAVGGAIGLLAVVLAASAFARERQYGSWEVLLQTGVRASEFLAGARWGILRALLPAIVLLGVLVVFFGFSSTRTWNVACVLLAGWLALQALLRLGLLNSLLHSRVGLAIGTTALAVAAATMVAALAQHATYGPVLAIPAAACLIRLSTGNRMLAALVAVFAAVYCTPVMWLEHALLGAALGGAVAYMPWLGARGRLGTWLAGAAVLSALGALAIVAAPHVFGFSKSELNYYWRRFATPGELAEFLMLAPGQPSTAERLFGTLGGFGSLTKLNWDLRTAAPLYTLLVTTLLAVNYGLEALLRRRFDSLAGRMNAGNLPADSLESPK